MEATDMMAINFLDAFYLDGGDWKECDDDLTAKMISNARRALQCVFDEMHTDPEIVPHSQRRGG